MRGAICGQNPYATPFSTKNASSVALARCVGAQMVNSFLYQPTGHMTATGSQRPATEDEREQELMEWSIK